MSYKTFKNQFSCHGPWTLCTWRWGTSMIPTWSSTAGTYPPKNIVLQVIEFVQKKVDSKWLSQIYFLVIFYFFSMKRYFLPMIFLIKIWRKITLYVEKIYENRVKNYAKSLDLIFNFIKANLVSSNSLFVEPSKD